MAQGINLAKPLCSPCSALFNNSRASSSKKDAGVQRYLRRQMTDAYGKLAREHSYRARSAFKLIEINERFKIVKPGDVVLDVGAAPGSWCQVLSEVIHPLNHPERGKGLILGPMSPVEGAELIGQADITRPGTHAEISRRLGNRQFNAIVSDMAPDATGTYAMDHERIVALVRTVFRLFADSSPALPLIENGKFLCKLWDGPRRAEFTKDLQARFRSVKVVKPDASREHSAELYLFANGFIAPPVS